jgi:hypothetical protein
MKTDQEIIAKVNYKVSVFPQKLIDSYVKTIKRKDWKKVVAYAARFLSAKDLRELGCRVWQGHNIVPNVFKNELADLIAGNTISYTLKANYVALGSNATTVANTDTQLGTETIRATFTNREAVTNVAYLDKYFDSFQVSGNTYREIGVFIDGSATVNTGLLLSHININETIAEDETIIVNVTLTIS